MKSNLITLIFALLCSIGYSQTPKEKAAVESAIRRFGELADRQDDQSLALLLDDNFRLVMNQMFGSVEAMIMTKQMYLDKIKKKEFGGEKREVTIDQVVVVGKNASATASFKGSKMTFVSLIHLIQDKTGNWKMVNDMPTVL